jgi:hypothetical protein
MTINTHVLAVFFLYFSCLVTCSSLQAVRQPVNKTVAIIYHPEGAAWILQSDLRPALDGSPRNLERAIFERLVAFEAQKYKIIVSEADIDKRLAEIQKHFESQKPGTTLKDIFKQFEAMGIAEGDIKEELKTSQLVEMMVEHRIKSKILVSKKDVELYNKNNPVLQIKQAFIPYSTTGSVSEQKLLVEQALTSGGSIREAYWTDIIDLKVEDLAKDKAYIKDLKPDTKQILNETPEGIALVHFLGNKPLNDVREKEIMYLLHSQRLEKALDDYNKELLAGARVKYLY